MNKKIFNWIKKNWLLIIISIIFIGVIFYSSNNTSYASDDYPYSFFYRADARVSNIIQVAKNQVSDYFNISGRVITNGLGQVLLMLPRSGFSILNAIVLLINAILSLKIVEEYSEKAKKYRPIIFALITGLFFAIDLSKHLVYWVMGAANYTFTLPIILLAIYLTKKWGLFKYPKLTGLFLAFACACHESLLVFFIIYILGNMIYDLILKKPFNKWYIYYIIMIMLAGSFLLLSPGNRSRSIVGYEDWHNMNIIEKLMTSIPAVSQMMFGINSYHNLIPLFFMLIISITLISKKDKTTILLGIANLAVYSLAFILNDGWLYFIAVLLLFIAENYYHYLEKNYGLIVTSLSFYAIVYSMIITPEYFAGRPNYFMYWYMIIIIAFIINKLNHKYIKSILAVLTIFVVGFFTTRDVLAYQKLGKIIDERDQALANASRTQAEYVFIKKIPEELEMFQADANSLGEADYWAHQHMCKFYNLNKNIVVILVN